MKTLTPEELLGKHISTIVSEEDCDRMQLLAAVRTGARMTRGIEPEEVRRA